jgi:hypothetical protein
MTNLSEQVIKQAQLPVNTSWLLCCAANFTHLAPL